VAEKMLFLLIEKEVMCQLARVQEGSGCTPTEKNVTTTQQ
jgi:hypothetical protein